MSNPYSECSIMIDYPGRDGQRVVNKKGKIMLCIEGGVPTLLVQQGTKKVVIELDSDDITSFKIDATNITDSKSSLQFVYKYGMLCNIMLSDPETFDGFLELIKALKAYCH
ncbi:hypothetical protein EIN_146380 [Entamoeba invadens IP1]|uniref:Uncharacterized protein n=1 Tax=Entamoeba invadens IP1 TaxID=370355 RepID=L7FNB6_ENTIV|nr:hypothetical protein EIN_146380 [Entamoeba invadens IP1]ELP87634.1 hypothetical protein EIN_146380 [Entamoeba invadens IP1]|eukprot:XP_004254405.1 hypothetical protein EIN_146380 [Entamoeba invadens IP1]